MANNSLNVRAAHLDLMKSFEPLVFNINGINHPTNNFSKVDCHFNNF